MSKRAAAGLLVGLALLWLAPEAWSAGDEHGAAEEHGASWSILALHALNFAFLSFLLYRYAWPLIVDFMSRRSKEIRAEIESAGERLRAAERELAELRARLADFGQEEERIASLAFQQGESEKARTIDRARETAQRIREDAERVANQEIERARQILREEAAELATELAGELLRGNLTSDDDRRLVDEFADRIGAES